MDPSSYAGAVHLDRPRLHLSEVLGQLDDAYVTADEAPESPRRRTLVELVGGATGRVEAANEAWTHHVDALIVQEMLGAALQSCVLVDLLSEVVIRDGDAAVSPTPAELDLHDRVRAILAAARPSLVLAVDAVADAAVFESHASRQSTVDTMLDLMLAADQMREWFRARSEARLPTDRAARETALLSVTLARHCLDRTVAAVEALNDGEPEAAFRDLSAAGSAIGVCEDRLPEDAIFLWPLITESLDNLRQ